MTRWTNHYGPALAAAFAFFGMCLLVGAGIYTFRQQRHVDTELCTANVQNRSAIRNTWLAAEELVLKGIVDPEQRTRTTAFFAAVLRPIPPLVCIDNQPVPKED